MLFTVNYLSVFMYGLLIMVFLLDIRMDKKNLVTLSAYVAISVIFQFILYAILGWPFLEKVYPFVVHLPLLTFFCTFFKKRLDCVLFVLCTAYILTTPRRWIGDLLALFFNNNQSIAAIFKMIVSIPLLFVIYKYLRPYVIKILAYSDVKIRLLVIIPLIYYVIAYLTTVYTQLLYLSRVVVIGILTTGLASVFYYFLVAYFNELEKRFEIQNEQNILSVQLSALQARTETMKQAEENAMIHRHDLRHHLHLINGYLIENNTAEAQKYIVAMEETIDNTATVKYCDNQAINLILSSYINMAKNENIAVKTQAYIPKTCEIADMDLCIILANAIENAINACMNIKETSNRKINISCKSKNDKLFIEVTNSFIGVLQFKNDMPVTDRNNHGFGTRSIAATVEKYKGIYSFTAQDGIFKMNVIL
jgi:hypothetical protein